MKKNVDRLLRKWHRARQKSAGQLQPLARKISNEVVRRRQQRTSQTSTDGPGEQKRPEKPDNTRK